MHKEVKEVEVIVRLEKLTQDYKEDVKKIAGEDHWLYKDTDTTLELLGNDLEEIINKIKGGTKK